MDRCSKFGFATRAGIIGNDLLSSKNKEASVLHAGLIANLKNELAGFEMRSKSNCWQSRRESIAVGMSVVTITAL